MFTGFISISDCKAYLASWVRVCKGATPKAACTRDVMVTSIVSDDMYVHRANWALGLFRPLRASRYLHTLYPIPTNVILRSATTTSMTTTEIAASGSGVDSSGVADWESIAYFQQVHALELEKPITAIACQKMPNYTGVVEDIFADTCVAYTNNVDFYSPKHISRLIGRVYNVSSLRAGAGGEVTTRGYEIISAVEAASLSFSDVPANTSAHTGLRDAPVHMHQMDVTVTGRITTNDVPTLTFKQLLQENFDCRLLGKQSFDEDTYLFKTARGWVSNKLSFYGWVDDVTYWSVDASYDPTAVGNRHLSVLDELAMMAEERPTLAECANPLLAEERHATYIFRLDELRYLSQAGTSRLFVPRPYVASPMYNSLGLPWFLDYVHLSSWFFFMALFVVVMWINIASTIFAKHVEARQPMRETRGFSRAQTGDGITAVLPMTWSITMLMHASTHSVNFDENTAGTTFTLTIIAYQWGWNYYFPRDVVDAYIFTPRQLGSGGVDGTADIQYYDKLLNYTLQSRQLGFSSNAKLASRIGKNVAPNILSFFLLPSGVLGRGEILLPMFLQHSSEFCGVEEAAVFNGSVGAGRQLAVDGATHTLYSRFLELIDEGGLSLNSAMATSLYQGGVVSPLGNDIRSSSLLFNRYFFNDGMLRYRMFDALRAKTTTAMSSNRLMLIYDNLNLLQRGNFVEMRALSAHDLSAAVAVGSLDDTSASLQDTLPFVFYGLQRSVSGGLSSLWALPSQFNVVNTSLFYTSDNIRVNTWLTFFNFERFAGDLVQNWLVTYTTDITLLFSWSRQLTIAALWDVRGAQNGTLAVLDLCQGRSRVESALTRAFESCISTDYREALLAAGWLVDHAAASAVGNDHIVATAVTSSKLLDYSAATPSYMRPAQFDHTRAWINTSLLAQLFTHTSADTCFLFYFSSLLTSEDFGLNFSPAIKELTSRMSSYTSYLQYTQLCRFFTPQGAVVPNTTPMFGAAAFVSNANTFTFIFFDVAMREALAYSRLNTTSNTRRLMEPGVSSRLLNLRQSVQSQAASADLSGNVSALNYTNYLEFFSLGGAGALNSTRLVSVLQDLVRVPTTAVGGATGAALYDNHHTLFRAGGSAASDRNASTTLTAAHTLLQQPPLGFGIFADLRCPRGVVVATPGLYTIFSVNSNWNVFVRGNTSAAVGQFCRETDIVPAFVVCVDRCYYGGAMLFHIAATSQAVNTGITLSLRTMLVQHTHASSALLRGSALIGGDFFTPAQGCTLGSSTVGMGDALLVNTPWFLGVDGGRPIRQNTGKIMDPAIFCFKLESIPTRYVKYGHKQLFDWGQGWGLQVQNFNLPLYKLFRGAIIKKPNGLYTTTAFSHAATDQAQLLELGTPGWWNQPMKNSLNAFFFIPRLHQVNFASVQDASRRVLLTPTSVGELVPMLKNRIIRLPQPHEEFDINFVYSFWAPEINTTRRADHGSRFKTTWNAFFSAQSAHAATSGTNLPSGAGLSNAFYTNNEAGCGAYSGRHYTGMPAIFVTGATDASAFNRVGEHTVCTLLTNAVSGFLMKSSSQHGAGALVSATNARSEAASWSSLWSYRGTHPNYKLSDIKPHTSGLHWDFYTTKFSLLSSLRTRDLARLARMGSIGTSADAIIGRPEFGENALRGLTAGGASTARLAHCLLGKVGVLSSRQYRSAYEVVRCDVGSMRRLRVTKGICLPADYPIHIICGSKDVVHSWAIPGLGVKIDCIPGYNSHRRVLFRWRGVYWGQCMEVCGRYHHWMPILVRIVHRDAFLSWCLVYLRALNTRAVGARQARCGVVTLVDWLQEDSTSLSGYVREVAMTSGLTGIL